MELTPQEQLMAKVAQALQKGITYNVLSLVLKAAPGTIKRWQKGVTMPYAPAIPEILKAIDELMAKVD